MAASNSCGRSEGLDDVKVWRAGGGHIDQENMDGGWEGGVWVGKSGEVEGRVKERVSEREELKERGEE